jgi:hypothetical protein
MVKCSRISLLLLMILSVQGCYKSGSAIDNSGIVGHWVWVSSNMGGSIITPANGVQRSLLFEDNGALFITHNDSTGDVPSLLLYSPLVLNAQPIVDTTTYQLTTLNAGCVSLKFPALLTSGKVQYYSYTISNDSLVVSPPPCLIPNTSIYIRH